MCPLFRSVPLIKSVRRRLIANGGIIRKIKFTTGTRGRFCPAFVGDIKTKSVYVARA